MRCLVCGRWSVIGALCGQHSKLADVAGLVLAGAWSDWGLGIGHRWMMHEAVATGNHTGWFTELEELFVRLDVRWESDTSTHSA